LILRIYRFGKRDLTAIAAELDLLKGWRAANLAVPVVVAMTNGETILTLAAPEGARYAVMLKYIEGVTLNDRSFNNFDHFSLDKFSRYGAAIAQLHMVSDQMTTTSTRPPLDLEFLLETPLRLITKVLSDRPKDLDYLHTAAATLRQEIQLLPQEPPLYGLCHGDIDCSNVLINDNGDLTLIDFDYCGMGWRVYDIACFYVDAEYLKLPDAVKPAFLAGYSQIRVLSDREYQSIPLFAAVRHIWYLGLYAENINEWGRFRLYDEFVDYVLGLVHSCLEDRF